MSTISVTTVTTANATTDQTVRTGNAAAGAVVIPAGGTGVVLQGNSTTNTVIANATQVIIKSTVGINANGSLGSNGLALVSNGSAVYWGAAGGNVQTFSTSGTWTKPASGTVALIQCWGAGGSGGANGGGGGGGGGYNQSIVLLSTLGATETVTIGTGGAASNSSNSGSPGGATTFGSWVAAYGGSGGNAASQGCGGAGGNPFFAPLTANANPSFTISRIGGYDGSGGYSWGKPFGVIGQGSGSNYLVGIPCSVHIMYDAVDGIGVLGVGGGGGSQCVATSNGGQTQAKFANTLSGTYVSLNDANQYRRTGNPASGGAAGGGGAGRSTGAVYAGGVGSGSGGAGGNNTTAAVGGIQPGGGGGGGPQTSNSIAVSAAGGNGMCIVIVI